MPPTTSAHLPTLLKRYEALTREIAAREAERVAVHDQILATGRHATGRTPKTPGPGRPARTTAQTVEVVRDTVRVLREAGTPLPRREVAARSTGSPTSCRRSSHADSPDVPDVPGGSPGGRTSAVAPSPRPRARSRPARRRPGSRPCGARRGGPGGATPCGSWQVSGA